MKNNKFVYLALAALIAISIWLYFSQNKSTFRSENSDFAVKDTASISRIFLSDKKNKNLVLDRTESGWLANEKYPVRKDVIDHLLNSICRVTVKAPVSKSSFETVIKNLAGESVKIEIYQGGDRPVKVYYVGGATPDHMGTFMLMEESSVPFITHMEGFRGFLTPRYSTNVNEWRSTEVFAYNYGEIEFVKVENSAQPEESFMITDLGNNSFAVTGADGLSKLENPDTASVYQYLSYFKKVHYEGVEETKPLQYVDSIVSGKPRHIITVKSKSGKTKMVKTFPKPVPPGIDMFGDSVDTDIDRMYATINDSDFVVIQYFVFDPITRKLSQFKK